MTIKLSDFGNSLGTHIDAKKIREQIMNENEKTILDFEGISIISNSFADEILGIIVRDFGIKKLSEKVSFKNTNNEIQMTIKKAIIARS